MSAAHIAAGSSTGIHQDNTLPLQPIAVSHPANHRANAATGSKEKAVGHLMPGNSSAGESSTAIPEPPSENAFPDVAVGTSVEMSDTGGYPLQRYPNAIQAEMDIFCDDGWTSHTGKGKSKSWGDDMGAGFSSRPLFPPRPRRFDAEDERRMITKYIDAMNHGKIWDSTRHCGRRPIFRKHHVAPKLHQQLFQNMFASAVNYAYTAMGGHPCYWIHSIYLDGDEVSAMGVRIAEVGDIHTLCNVQLFRALPYHDHDYYHGDWLSELPQPNPPVGEADEVSVFEHDEEVATEFGDPEAGEWAGEYDETETF